MVDKERMLQNVMASLRSISNLRDFVAAMEVGAKVAGDILTDVETALLEALEQIGEPPQ